MHIKAGIFLLAAGASAREAPKAGAGSVQDGREARPAVLPGAVMPEAAAAEYVDVEYVDSVDSVDAENAENAESVDAHEELCITVPADRAALLGELLERVAEMDLGQLEHVVGRVVDRGHGMGHGKGHGKGHDMGAEEYGYWRGHGRGHGKHGRGHDSDSDGDSDGDDSDDDNDSDGRHHDDDSFDRYYNWDKSANMHKNGRWGKDGHDEHEYASMATARMAPTEFTYDLDESGFFYGNGGYPDYNSDYYYGAEAWEERDEVEDRGKHGKHGDWRGNGYGHGGYEGEWHGWDEEKEHGPGGWGKQGHKGKGHNKHGGMHGMHGGRMHGPQPDLRWMEGMHEGVPDMHGMLEGVMGMVGELDMMGEWWRDWEQSLHNNELDWDDNYHYNDYDDMMWAGMGMDGYAYGVPSVSLPMMDYYASYYGNNDGDYYADYADYVYEDFYYEDYEDYVDGEYMDEEYMDEGMRDQLFDELVDEMDEMSLLAPEKPDHLTWGEWGEMVMADDYAFERANAIVEELGRWGEMEMMDEIGNVYSLDEHNIWGMPFAWDTPEDQDRMEGNGKGSNEGNGNKGDGSKRGKPGHTVGMEEGQGPRMGMGGHGGRGGLGRPSHSQPREYNNNEHNNNEHNKYWDYGVADYNGYNGYSHQWEEEMEGQMMMFPGMEDIIPGLLEVVINGAASMQDAAVEWEQEEQEKGQEEEEVVPISPLVFESMDPEELPGGVEYAKAEKTPKEPEAMLARRSVLP